jgi:hypothetical protein
MAEIPEEEPRLPEIDTSRPHEARMYDYCLGGKNNFAADRAMADALLRIWPSMRTGARENRAFLGRTVGYLAREAGIRQFLDIGTGLPTSKNVHDVAQAIAPDSRVVYCDSDPLVLAHARALLTSSPQGRTAYIHADFRDPVAILSHPDTREVLNFGQPVALILAALLHYILDEDKPATILATLLDALPPGSFLVASHLSAEFFTQKGVGQKMASENGIKTQTRDSDEFARLAFSGLDLVPPGVVPVSDWRPDESGPRPAPAEVRIFGGVAAKS